LTAIAGFSVATLAATSASAAATGGMTKGKAGLKSAGSLAFGPEGVLFVADPKGAAVFAVATGDTAAGGAGETSIEKIDAKIAALLGTTADDVVINDLAVNPLSGKTYLSVSRGQGPDAAPAIIRNGAGGKLELVSLDDVMFSKLEIADAPEDRVSGEGRRQRNPRMESVTDMAFLDGRLAIAGLSNEEFASTLRVAGFPFDGEVSASGVEIYHGAHGALETQSPIRTFTPMDIDGEPTIVASYTCTPLVTIPLSELRPDNHVKGITVAELGNRNRPLDMVTYSQGGKDFILMANNARGVMKISAEGIGAAEPIDERVPDGNSKGLPYETVEAWTGITQLDKVNDEAVVVLRQEENGDEHLEHRPMP
jgi:hypothetical protein